MMAEMSVLEKLFLDLYTWQAFFTLEWSLLDKKMNILSFIPISSIWPTQPQMTGVKDLLASTALE